MGTYAWQSISNAGGTVPLDQNWNTPTSWVAYPITNPPITGTVPGGGDTAVIWAASVNVAALGFSQTYPVSVDVTDSRVVSTLGLAGIAVTGVNFVTFAPVFGTPTLFPVVKVNGGTLSVSGNIADNFIGSITVPNLGIYSGAFSGGGTVDIGSAGTLAVGGTVGAAIQVDFTDSHSDVLRLSDVSNTATNAFAGTVNGFQSGDTILLSGLTSLHTLSKTYSGGMLTVTDSVLGTVAAIDVNTIGNGGFILTEGAAGLAITLGSAPPSTPKLDPASDSGTKGDNVTNVAKPTLDGTGDAGATIKLWVDGSALGVGAVVSQTGAWSVSLSSALTNGAHTIYATEADVGSSFSTPSGTLTVTIDTIAPVAPSGLKLTDGIGNTGTIAHATPPVFTGTAEAGSIVSLLDAGVVVGSTKANATTGAFTITGTGLAFGNDTIVAQATDAAGNIGLASGSIVVDVIALPPGAPILAPSSDSGTKGDLITNVTKPTFTGTGDPNALITLLDSGVVIASGTASIAGAWTIASGTALINGTHTITATQTDAGGPASAPSTALLLNIDTVPPVAPSIPVLTDGIGNTGSIFSNVTPIFTGTAEVGSIVSLLDAGVVVGSATASGPGGAFTLSPTVALALGNNTIVARATDIAGNIGSPSGSIVVDVLAPNGVYWTKAAGNFAVAANWSPAHVPLASDNAVINAPGTYTVSSSVNETVKTLSVIPTASLAISAGVFSILNGSGTLGLGGIVNVGGGAILSLAGTVVNSGIINETGGANPGEILVNAPTVTLSGGGHVNLLNNVGDEIIGAAANDLLVNLDNKIAGGGRIGTGMMRLANQTGGTINASLTTSLTINTGPNAITNMGLLESTNHGGLVLDGTILNAGGTIAAIGVGAIVDLAADVLGGTLASTAGTVVAIGSSATLDGRGLHPVTNSGYLQVPDAAVLTLLGYIQNSGTIGMASTTDATSLYIGPLVTLAGGGKVLLSNNANNDIIGTAAGNILDNVNNTIAGAGQLGEAQLRLVNTGLINANQVTALTVNTGAVRLENGGGTMEATAKGGLILQSQFVGNAGGTILASGAGSFVQLAGADIIGGTLATAAGGIIDLAGAGTLDGLSSGRLTSNGSIIVDDGDMLTLLGSIANNGVLFEKAVSGTAYIVLGSPVVTLSGTGSVVLSDDVNNLIYGNLALDRLVNGEIISGAGQIGLGQMRLTNLVNGIIIANQPTSAVVGPGSLTLNTGANAILNQGLLESTNSGGLVLQSDVANAGGTIKAVGAGAHVDLATSNIMGGTVTTSAGGVIRVSTGGLDGMSYGPIAISGSVVVSDGGTLNLVGNITNNGTILANGLTATTSINIGAPGVQLSGNGTIRLSSQGLATLGDATPATSLHNISNIIAGAGQIGNGYLSLTNDVGGVINADQAKALTLGFSSGDLFNSGLIEATSTVAGNGGLIISTTTVNNLGGTIAATGTNAHVDLSSGGILGGTLNSTGGGVVNVLGGAVLDGATNGALFERAFVRVTNGSILSLDGTIANSGTIGLLASNATTELMVASQNVWLTGGGLVSLSNSANNLITGGTPGSTLNNVDNTIAGGGQLGAGQLTLNNSGTINASTGNSLTINTGAQVIYNQGGGLLEATSSGGLILASGLFDNFGTVLAGDGSRVTLQGGVTTINNDDGVLVGGTWAALSAGKGANVLITGGPVTTDAATIVLSGTNSFFRAGDGTTFTALEASLNTIAAGGTLDVLGNRNYTTGQTIADSGLLQLGGGTLAVGGLNVAGGIAGGTGTIAAKSVTNNGSIGAVGGTLVIAGTIDPTSSGLFILGNNSGLELGTDLGHSNRMSFMTAGTLTLDNAAQFGIGVGTTAYAGPLLQQFGTTDAVVLKNILAAGLTPNYTAATGLLQIGNGTTTVATLDFDTTSLGAGSFHLTADSVNHLLTITHT